MSTNLKRLKELESQLTVNKHKSYCRYKFSGHVRGYLWLIYRCLSRVKSALGDIRKKLLDSDQYCVCHAVEVVDFVTKNCSAEVHKEVLSSDFLNVMKSVIMVSCFI